MKGVLSGLVCWSLCASTRDFCVPLAALVGPGTKYFYSHPTLFQCIYPHRPASWALSGQAVVLGRLSFSVCPWWPGQAAAITIALTWWWLFPIYATVKFVAKLREKLTKYWFWQKKFSFPQITEFFATFYISINIRNFFKFITFASIKSLQNFREHF